MTKTAMIRDEIAALAGAADEISRPEAVRLFQLLAAKFGTTGTRPLWERLRDAASVLDPQGWRRVAGYVSGAAFLLIEGSDGDDLGFRFDSVRELVRVLAETSNFVFYVTDSSLSYLLAFNDHDYLIGAGAAREWLAAPHVK